ncbi:hypothetical protein MMC06_006793, partial [Schaereria dolodes]|nr:hypothetical protein [Schaereria dolodes]
SLYKSFITAVVGEDRTEFRIHRGLLCEYSHYFRAALGGSFAEATTGIVELIDEDLETFGIFYTWLYSGLIVVEVDGEEEAVSTYQLVRLYAFADRRGIAKLRNDCINNLLAYLTRRKIQYIIACSEELYDTTSSVSHLRMLVADSLACINLDRFLKSENWKSSLPKDLLVDVLIARGTNRGLNEGSRQPWKIYVCQYHEHSEDERLCNHDDIIRRFAPAARSTTSASKKRPKAR